MNLFVRHPGDTTKPPPWYRSPHRGFRILSYLALILVIVLPVWGGTETLITVNTSESAQSDPVIAGDWIVWTDMRTGDAQVYAYNVVTGVEQRLSSSAAIASQPDIAGNRVVWRDGRNGNFDIYLYDMVAGTETPISPGPADQQYPVIDGDNIVWEDDRSGTSDIYLYHIPSSQETLLSPDAPGAYKIRPALSGTNVVWQDNRNYYPFDPINLHPAGYYYDIFLNATATGILANISHDATDPGADDLTPAISGDTAVWVDERYGEKGDIFRYNLNTGARDPVTESNLAFKILPDIDGSDVVWFDNRNIKYDVYRRDLTTLPGGTDTQITGPGAVVVSSGKGPKISGNRIVWTDYRNGNNDVYLYTLGADETCPVANFSLSAQTGPVPLTVQFSDESLAGTVGITHRRWDFGDGNSTTDQVNPGWTYTVPGAHTARLTVSNPLCRNETPVSVLYTITAGSAPVASFSAVPVSGMVPLTVKFTDASVGATAWNWSFGDGSFSDAKDPSHLYGSGGTYVVLLNASNSYGYSDATLTVSALTGANVTASTSIAGIGTDYRYGSQFLIFNGTKLGGYTHPSPGVLVSPPIPDAGWQNITFVTADPAGFHDFGNGTLMGNITAVVLTTTDITPAGFSDRIGPLSSVNYSVTLSAYPENAVLNTRIWEGYTPEDLAAFRTLAKSAGYTYLWDVAYTTRVVGSGFPAGGTGQFRMSVNSSWVAANTGRDHTFAERIADDRATGEVLRAVFISRDPAANLDNFIIDSPHGLSTFGLVQLSGSGNPLQIITLTVTSHAAEYISQGASSGTATDSDSSPAAAAISSGKSAVPGQQAPPEDVPANPDPGRTGTIYTNPNGVTTQATTLVSTDTRATVSVLEGVTARDVYGKPLSSITIGSVPPGALPADIQGNLFADEGMAYEIGPDGATFTPAITVTFTVPQAAWNRDYTIRSYDRATRIWHELPTVFDPSTGAVSAQVAHLCSFALFSKVPRTPPGSALAPVEVRVVSDTGESSSTAASTYTTLMIWAENFLVSNLLLIGVIVLVVLGCAIVYKRYYQW